MIKLSFQFSEEIIKIHWYEFYFLRKNTPERQNNVWEFDILMTLSKPTNIYKYWVIYKTNYFELAMIVA